MYWTEHKLHQVMVALIHKEQLQILADKYSVQTAIATNHLLASMVTHSWIQV